MPRDEGCLRFLQGTLRKIRGTLSGGDEQFRREFVQDHAMSGSTFPIEFIGGSRDGEIIQAAAAPDYFEVAVGGGVKEIYERQNDVPPFVYVQIGYAGNETWK
jgi:hypothetical protein